MTSFTGPGWVMLAAWVPPSITATPPQPTRPAARASALSMEIEASAVPWTTRAGAVISPRRSAMLSRSSSARPGFRSDSAGRYLQIPVHVADSPSSPMMRAALASATSSDGPFATQSSIMA